MLNLVTLVVMSFRFKTLSLVKSCVDLFCIYLHIYILWSSPCIVPCLSCLWFCHIPTLGNVYVCGAVSKIYFNCFRVVETLNRMSYPVPGGYSGQVRRMYHFLWTKLQVQNSSTILLTPSLCRPIVFLLPRDCPPFPSPFFPYVKQISSVSVFLLFCGPNIFLLSLLSIFSPTQAKRFHSQNISLLRFFLWRLKLCFKSSKLERNIKLNVHSIGIVMLLINFN